LVEKRSDKNKKKSPSQSGKNWDNTIYQAVQKDVKKQEQIKRNKKTQSFDKRISKIFIFLIALVALFVVFIVWVIIWLNSPNNANAKWTVASSSTPSASVSSSSESVSSSSSTSTSSSDGSTYTIVAGDDPNTIVSKTGVAWAKIVQLNSILDPSPMRQGYLTNGGAIYPGLVLHLKTAANGTANTGSSSTVQSTTANTAQSNNATQ